MLEYLDWRAFVVTFLYCCVALGLFYAWRKGLDIRTHEDRIEEVVPPPKKPKFKEKGEVVGTGIVHMAERLKIENIEQIEKPHWPIKENEK